MFVRAVICGGRADENLGLRLAQFLRIRQLADLILLGVACLEILAHRARYVRGLGRCTKVDAVRLQVLGEFRVRGVGARAAGHQEDGQ